MEIQLAGGSGQQAELRGQRSDIGGQGKPDLWSLTSVMDDLNGFSDLNYVNYEQLTTDYGLL